MGRAHVLAHVIDPRGRGYGAGDGRVGDDELEEKLGPVGAVELARPGGQRIAFEMVEQRALPERPVDDRREAQFFLWLSVHLCLSSLTTRSVAESG